MNIYNGEMYPDPTAYHALTKIQKEKRLQDTDRLSTYVALTPVILPGIQKKLSNTAALPLITMRYPLHRTFCFRSLWMKKKSVILQCLWIWF